MVEDGGLGWLKKSYQRMKEQSERENKDLEEIIAERYGVSIGRISSPCVCVYKNPVETEKN